MEALRVLVVDDEAGMRQGVVRILGRHTVAVHDLGVELGFTVDQAENGQEALERIQESPPDILLLDHKLPGITGLDVLERMSELGVAARIHTVMITAYASLETAVTAIKRGAFDFLPKPFTPDDLRAVIDKIAEKIILARQARKLAREKHQTRFEFISVLAHELKAPLAAVEGYLATVRQKAVGDDQAAYDHMLDRSLIRLSGMRKMIMDLLDLTRIESGKKRRELSTVDLKRVIADCRESFAGEARARGITVEAHVPDGLTMTADRGELDIIFNNLVSNAIKYNRDGGRVEVSAESDGELIRVRVRDTGIGLSEDEAGRLFGDFVRIKNAQTRNILGSGLGLSIVRKLALAYGGKAAVESKPDVGSTFIVTLNRSGPTPENAEPPK